MVAIPGDMHERDLPMAGEANADVKREVAEGGVLRAIAQVRAKEGPRLRTRKTGCRVPEGDPLGPDFLLHNFLICKRDVHVIVFLANNVGQTRKHVLRNSTLEWTVS